MSVITADFVERLSGGASNSDGNASLGGVKSSNTKSSTVDAFFDAVSAAEAAAGRVEYRCTYLHNANSTDTMTNAVVFVSSNTPLAGTNIIPKTGGTDYSPKLGPKWDRLEAFVALGKESRGGKLVVRGAASNAEPAVAPAIIERCRA